MKKTILTKGKLMYKGKLYNKGDAIPESETSRKLIREKRAEVLDVEENAPESGDGYEKMTVTVLRDLAKIRDLEIQPNAKKDDLVALLRAKDQSNGDDGGVS